MKDPNCFEYHCDIGNSDIEPRYRHVHHAHALVLMERARSAFLDSIGTALEKFIVSDLYIVITEVNVKYRRELVRGPIIITCEDRRIERRLLSLSQRVLIDGQTTAVEAAIKMVFMLGASKRAVSPPADFARDFIGGS